MRNFEPALAMYLYWKAYHELTALAKTFSAVSCATTSAVSSGPELRRHLETLLLCLSL